jgi:hypothetical protein
MATPRNRIGHTADDVLNAVLFGPLTWPGRTVRLERNSLLDYRNRPTSAQVSVAELYHEHSKLSPQQLPELVFSSVDAAEVRRTYLGRRALLAGARPGDELDELAPWRGLLADVAERGLECFYAIDVRVLAGDLLAAWEPAGNAFRLLKRLDDHARERLDTAMRLGRDGEGVPRQGALLLVLACFPRNEILFGPRGYRRTLLEAGRVAQELLDGTARAGRTGRVHYEFADTEVDQIMEVDGVEYGTVVAVTVW